MLAAMKGFFDSEFLARLERLHLIAKRPAASATAGRQRSGRLGDGLEFADHRAYAPGDDIRFVDWPYFARMEKLLLRMFHEHSELEVRILLDTSASMAPSLPDATGEMAGADAGADGNSEKFRYACRAAAAMAYIAMGALRPVIVLPFAEHLARPFRAGRNRRKIIPLLEFLAALAHAGRTDLAACAEQFARRITAPGQVLLLTDLLDCADDLPQALAYLRLAGHDVTVLHLFSPQDTGALPDGPALLRSAETATEMTIPITENLRRDYHTRWSAFCRRCEAACTSRQATYVPAATDIPFESLILQTLRQAHVLAGR